MTWLLGWRSAGDDSGQAARKIFASRQNCCFKIFAIRFVVCTLQ